MLKNGHIPYLRDNFCCKLASESTILAVLAVCGLYIVYEEEFHENSVV